MSEPVEIVICFNDALNERDLETMMQLMSADCVFENTYPPPDGERFQGQEAIRGFWEQFFQSAGRTHFTIEEIFGVGERCVMLWTYHWEDPAGQQGHIRGVDVYRVAAGRITEKLSYVKG